MSRDREGAVPLPDESPETAPDPVVVMTAPPAESPALEAAAEPVSEAVPAAESAMAAAEAESPHAPEAPAEPQDPAVATAPQPAIEPEPVETPIAEPIAVEPQSPSAQPQPEPLLPAGAPSHPHWLLSLFTPAPADSVDWRRGNYTVLPRGGRVDSPAGSGELKKQIQMVAEGSVLYAETPPRGSAADVAPDGFAHPVFRAGFAVAIPLPEVR